MFINLNIFVLLVLRMNFILFRIYKVIGIFFDDVLLREVLEIVLGMYGFEDLKVKGKV